MDTLWRVMERNAFNYADQTALRYPAANKTYTWSQLHQEATSLAGRLLAAGVQPGTTIGLYSANKPEFVLGFLAATALDAVIIPINIRLTTREIAGILADAKAEFLLFEQGLNPIAQELAQSGVRTFNLSTEPTSVQKTKQPQFNPNVLRSGLTAEILYTSGTTGKPKGVMLSHEAILSVAKIMTYEAGIYAGDNCLILMPLTHSAPLNLFLWGAFWAGASVTIGDFAPNTLLDYAAQEKTTHFFGAPIVYQLLSRMPNLKEWDLSSMKLWIYGGASVGGEQIRKWQEALPGEFMCVYGLTEAGPNGSALRPHEHGAKTGSIGRRGTANTEIRVVRADGTDTDPDEAGEMIIRSESLMIGYHGNPEATRETLRDGWLYTGDIARRDVDGYIWIMDRKKDMIISGGVNVYPKEVEDVLSTHPLIADVAVIGVPHPDWGESVLAKVVARPGESLSPEAVRDFCRDKLADYKIPRMVEIVEVLPRNASGKLLKHVMRAEWSAPSAEG
ncbi:MAG: AMP-binding protein [Desulfitobacteriaceae bacterium]|nr:AMP-binding protein [Desulfitobacteriaceae bacterium]MDI6915931.1 AMP-binding protein [Desulfitobacteriaceae bacterium]